MVIRKQLLFVAAVILAFSTVHSSTEIDRVLVKREVCYAKDCHKKHSIATGTIGVISGIACAFTFGIGCAIGGIAASVSELSRLQCDECEGEQEYPFDAKFELLQQSHNTLHTTQKEIYGMTEELYQMQNLLAYNQDQLSSDVHRVQVVLNDLKEDQEILAHNQQRIFDQTNLILGGQLQIAGNQEQIFNQTLIIEARQRQTHLNQQQLANLIGDMNENLEGVIYHSQNILYKKITSFLTETNQKQSEMIEMGFTITLYGDDIQHLQSLRSKYEHMQVDENGNIIDDADSLEFQEAADGRLHGAEISENIFKMLIGDHPLHRKSLYQVNSSFCIDTVKDYYNGLMQESFFYYSVSKAMSGHQVSSRRKNTKDKHLVQHESHYLKTCGCPDPNQYVGNREKRLSKIFKMLTLDHNNTYVQFFHSVSELLRQNVTFNVHALKIISSFAYIDFDNQVLLDLIRDTPIEDIALLAQLCLFNKDAKETQKQLHLLDDTYACYRSDTGFKNVKFSNGDLYGGFWKNSSREVYGVSVVSQNVTCYSQGYSGEWAQDKMDGHGIFFWSDGSFFKGMWKKGIQHGIGTKYYPSGNRQGLVKYEGEWFDGQRHGKGRLIWKNGDVFEGYFVNDAQKGNAAYQWANGDRYKGEYLLDRLQGLGQLTLRNKSLGNVDASWQTEDKLGMKKTFLLIFQNICKNNGTDCTATKIRKPMMKDLIVISSGNIYEGLNENLTGCGSVTYTDKNTYEGQFVKGIRHGRGKMAWKSGTVYEGDYIDGSRTGEGVYYYSDGSRYKGQHLKGDFTGHGTFTWTDGKKYTGQFKNDLRDGNGKFEWANGDKYIGQFKDNNKHGQGKIEWANGNKYEGDFLNDNRTGQGIFTWQDGAKYIGQFKDNNKHGQGKIEWANGNKYEGDFLNDNRTGQGIYIWQHGSKYTGQFKDNNKHGQGKIEWASGNKYEGDFINDNRTGQGTYIWQDGAKYIGQFKDNNKHGQGRIEFANGDKYEGEYQNDIRTGHGIYKWPNGDKYVGQYKDNKRNGYGTYYRKDGSIYHSGYWKDDEKV